MDNMIIVLFSVLAVALAVALVAMRLYPDTFEMHIKLPKFLEILIKGANKSRAAPSTVPVELPAKELPETTSPTAGPPQAASAQGGQATPAMQASTELSARKRSEIIDVATEESPSPLPVEDSQEQSSPFVVGGTIEDDNKFFGRLEQRSRLRKAIKARDSCQILGMRRMGKTCLLMWAKRHAMTHTNRRVVYIDAQGLTERSPAELVYEIAKELDCSAEAVAVSRGEIKPEKALKSLPSFVLLIDEAENLFGAGSTFDNGFLNVLRSLTQSRAMTWISASRYDLRDLIVACGFTSEFLNDTYKITVGQLEHEEVERLAEPLGPDLVAIVVQEAEGFAYAAQWLGDAFFLNKSNPERSMVSFSTEMNRVFRSWWNFLTKTERHMLGQCLRGLDKDTLTYKKTELNKLENLGLLTERDSRYFLPGAVWQRFVADQTA